MTHASTAKAVEPGRRDRTAMITITSPAVATTLASQIPCQPPRRSVSGEWKSSPGFRRLDDGAVHAVGGLLGEPYGRVCETRRNEICQVLAAGERAGDAADVRAALSALDRSEMILRDDIADSDSTTRHEHSVHLPDDLRLVSGQVDDAIADHNVD